MRFYNPKPVSKLTFHYYPMQLLGASFGQLLNWSADFYAEYFVYQMHFVPKRAKWIRPFPGCFLSL